MLKLSYSSHVEDLSVAACSNPRNINGDVPDAQKNCVYNTAKLILHTRTLYRDGNMGCQTFECHGDMGTDRTNGRVVYAR